MDDAEETTLSALQNELEFYKQNQTEVEDEIRTVIGDNQQLSQQVGQLLRDKLEYTRRGRDAEGCVELKAQLAFLTKERDSLHVLWQTSQKTIDALENELKTYQSYDSRAQQKNTNENRNDSELKLQASIAEYIELELKYKEAQAKINSLDQELKGREKEITSLKEYRRHNEQKMEELSRSFEECRINYETEKRCNDDLKTQLSLSKKEIADLGRRETEAKSKVAEALQLFDVVSSHKNEAYKRIAEITKELSHVKHGLANAKRDAETVYRKELDDFKEKFNEKIIDMLAHIRNLDTELVEKGMLLNKTLREVKILKEENEIFLKQQNDSMRAVEPKLKLAEQRMEAMFQELVASERRNIQTVCEKQCLAIEIQRMQDIHQREIKRRDWEENLLKTQCEELKTQVEHLQKSLEDTHGMVDKLQKMMSSRTELSHRMVSTKEEELTELNKHLENQMELSKKWKESYVEMAEKLKKRLEDLQKENRQLRTQLKLPCIQSSDSTS